MSLAFNLFDFPTGGGQPATLSIYDGDSTNAPLLGSFIGQELEGVVVSASQVNTSGCLTLVFMTFGNNADFMADISCTECDHPTAAFTTIMGDTVVVCRGDTLMVDGGVSQAASGQLIDHWTWSIFGNGQMTTMQPQANLVFTESGAFNLQLEVTDTSGCPSYPSENIVVLVSGPLSFSGTSIPDVPCAPGQVALLGNSEPSLFVLSNGVGEMDHDPGLFIPDYTPQAILSVIDVDWAEPSAMINEAVDLGEVCISMEHSYLNDLIMRLKCPNGQSANLHYQGGYGTLLGDANNYDDDDPIPGECWQYCFSSDPSYGTWESCGLNGTTPNVVQLSATYFALAPGAYTPVHPLSSFVGCPVNGSWTLEILDIIGQDNGYLCSWSIGVIGSTDSSFIGLSPNFTLDQPDSAFWSGADVTNIAGPNGTAYIPTSGEHSFIFTILDSYGCVHDTTITITSPQVPVVEAGADVALCAAPVSLGGQVTPGPPSVILQWWPTTGLSDPTDPQSTVSPPAYGWYTLSATTQGGECTTSDSVWVGPSAGITVLDWSAVNSTLCCDASGLDAYDWYLNGEFFTNTPINCLVAPPFGIWSVVAADGSGCGLISPPLAVCPELEIQFQEFTLSATPGLGVYNWTYNGTPVVGEYDASISYLGAGVYTVSLALAGCEDSTTLELFVSIPQQNEEIHDAFRILPNPNRGEAYLLLNKGVFSQVEVLDVAGRLQDRILANTTNSMIRIELQLAKGTYIIRVYTSMGTYSSRMIVE